MGDIAIQNAQSSRMRLLVWPREHGAWGILAIPLLTGGAAGMMQAASGLPVLLFSIAAISVFLLRTPVESLLGTTPMRAQTEAERRSVTLVIAIFSAVALVSTAALLWHGRNLALYALGAAAGLLFVVQTVVRKLGRRARMAAQLIGALGLTSTAAGAYYVLTGQFDERAVALWLANWIFAGNQIHFVQVRIHGCKLKTWEEKFRMARGFFLGQAVMVLVLVAAWRSSFLPGLALLAFAPVLVRGLVWFFSGREPLRVHRLGFTELAHALAFGAMLIVAFHFAL